jgi:16S rRNA (guanine966-N2)-methyltransferase
MGMRVIAGSAKGRRLKSPAIGTRPMTDAMKESLFSSLGDLRGLRVLDLYAGSGSLGLEALSRGARKSIFVEKEHEAIAKLELNVEATGFGRKCQIEWVDVKSLLARPADERMDLIFVDPPYNMAVPQVRADLESIVMGGWLADEGRVIVHRPHKEAQLKPFGLVTEAEKHYGQSRILIFRHEDE